MSSAQDLVDSVQFVFLGVNWGFKSHVCWPPPDERALKGRYSFEGAQGLRPGVVWKADSRGDLSWYPHYTGTEGTLYLQSATI